MYNEAELPITSDGRIYHLGLKPHELASTIITVGDPSRVERVSRYFDHVEYKVQNREFITHTGTFKNKPLSVISTGIGTPSIDIVLNELDVLVNVDFQTRDLKDNPRSLNIIRFGTTGSIHERAPIGSLVVSRYAIGLDNLLSFYPFNATDTESRLASECHRVFNALSAPPYVVGSDETLYGILKPLGVDGVTVTSPGFYAPQDRHLHKRHRALHLIEHLSRLSFGADLPVLNFEMETAAILGLSRVFGHRAISVAAVIADRVKGQFSPNWAAIVEEMIEQSLNLLVESSKIC